MKNFQKFLSLSLLSFCVPVAVFSQAVINNNAGNSTAGNYSSSTFEGQSDKLFDVDSDIINPGEGVMRWKGKIFSIEDSKLIRERFERYLSSPVPEGKAKDYQAVLKKISKLLEQNHIPQNQVNRCMIEAMALLVQASEFEADGKQSLTLAKQVYKACRQRAEIGDLQEWQKALGDEQVALQRKIDNREKIRRNMEESVKIGSGKDKQATKKQIPPTPEQVFLTTMAAENRATILSANKQSDVMGAQAKLEFQSTMIGFLMARRYDHALLSSAFYRILFKGTQHGIKVGEKEFADLSPVSNFVPSLETFDQIAREMQEETRKCVNGSNSLWSNNQKYHAFRQLLTAFFVGENELRIQYYPETRRREFLSLWLKLRELQRQSENKDIGVIEESLAAIRGIAPDFPDSEIVGKVRAAKLASNMAIMSARQALLIAGAKGTPEALSAAMDESKVCIVKAAEFWPQNPEIPKFMEEVLNRTNVMAQLAPEFDRLVAAGKKREIFRRRAEFTAALMQDAARRERFEKIVSGVAALETVLAQVNMLQARKDDFIAWDMLLTAEKMDPEDEEVILAKARAATRVSEYARLLDSAANDESKGNLGVALNTYLAAQEINPASEICRTAVSRVAEAILSSMPKSVPAGTPASKETVPEEPAKLGNTDGFDF